MRTANNHLHTKGDATTGAAAVGEKAHLGMLNSEEKGVATCIAIIELCSSEGISQSVSQ